MRAPKTRETPRELRFGSSDLIRIYYSLKADRERRERSPFAAEHWGEIQLNRDIMERIERELPHLDWRELKPL